LLAQTLLGLVFDALGRRPQVGERVIVGAVGLRVRELDGARIARLQVAFSR